MFYFSSYKVVYPWIYPWAGPLRKQHFDVSTPSGDSWTNFVPLKWSSSVEWNLRAELRARFVSFLIISLVIDGNGSLGTLNH